MGNSLMVGCAKMGMNFTACAPKKYFPDKALIDTCMEIAAQTGAEIKFCESPDEQQIDCFAVDGVYRTRRMGLQNAARVGAGVGDRTTQQNSS